MNDKKITVGVLNLKLGENSVEKVIEFLQECVNEDVSFLEFEGLTHDACSYSYILRGVKVETERDRLSEALAAAKDNVIYLGRKLRELDQ